jgi:hypothetical protein
MIRRDCSSHFLLITQHDHALLAGEFARRLRQDWLAAPLPYEETLEAIAQHDCGWPLHDDSPTLDAEGLPLHVFEAPVALATQVWSASAARAMNLGDYQGLLVSLHVLNLSAIQMNHAKNLSRADLFEMNKFQHRQIEIQEDLRGRLGMSNDVPRTLGLARPGASPADDQLLFNFRLLTAMDRISLSHCCGKLLFESLDDVLPKPGERPMKISLEMPEAGTMVIEPWLFDQPEMQFSVPARRVGKERFESPEAFHASYRGAEVEALGLTLRERHKT